MDVRALRRKRITILLTLVVVLAAVIAGLYVAQTARKKYQIKTMRVEGMAAYEAKDYPLAVEKLKPYIERRPADINAWYAYATSRLSAPVEDHSHVAEGLYALQHVNRMMPEHEQAADDLLELYTAVKLDEQAVELADQILARDPANLSVQRNKVVSLARLGRAQEAWELAKNLLEQQPQDMEIQLAAIQLRYKIGHAATEIVEDAQKQYHQHPDDLRSELCLGVAEGFAGYQEDAIKHLRSAAAKPMPKDVSLITVVRLLDRMDLFIESTALLVREVEDDDEPMLIHEKVRRLFEAGQLPLIEEMFKEQDMADAEPLMVAIMAMVQSQKGDIEQAKVLIGHLADRNDAKSRAWTLALNALLPRQLQPSDETIRVLLQAVHTSPDSVYLVSLLGDSYAAAQEWGLAAAQWRKAVKLRPVWNAPYSQLAKVMLNTGQFDQAQKFAQAAYVRQPNHVGTVMLIAQIQAAKVLPLDTRGRRDLMALFDQIDEALGSPASTFLLRINALSRFGDLEGVRQLIQGVIDGQITLPDESILRLVEISRRYELGLEDALWSQITATSGPQAMVLKALHDIEAGRANEAIAQVEAARQPSEPAWEIAWVRILDAAGDDRAATQWSKLAEQYAQNTRVQIMAIQSAALSQDRVAANRIVERLRQMLGDDATTWRVEHARWLLNQTQSDVTVDQAQALLREAISLEGTNLEAHVLAARAYEKAGRTSLAVRELQTAETLRPNALELKLELARLYQSMRSYEVASNQLNEVAHDPAATPSQLRQTAVLLAQQGADVRAIALLEGVKQRSADTQAIDHLLLATLYRRNGQMKKAAESCEQLMANPTPHGVLFVAGFYALQKQNDLARETLATLNTLDLTQAQRHTALATFFSKYGTQAETLEHYRAAIKEEPDNAPAWQRLVTYEIRIGRASDAIEDTQQAMDHGGDMRWMQSLLDHQNLVRRFSTHEIWRPLVVSILSEPKNSRRAIEALTAIEKVSDADVLQQANQLRSLAEDHREFLTLHLALARADISVGNTSSAAEIAQRAMYAFPTSVDAAWLTAEAMAVEQRWTEALVAASQWRQRSSGRAIGADMIVAEARLRMGEVHAAMREIHPYLDEALADPEAYPQVIVSYVRSLVADGQVPQAQAVLRPLLSQEVSWRTIWSHIAALAIDDTSVAAAWLNELERYTPEASFGEQARLAQSWWALYLRSKAPDDRDAARRWIDRVTLSVDATAEAWMLKGLLAEAVKERSVAIEAYRQAMALNRDLNGARNNLAMVLLDDDDALDEAIELARTAVEAEPRNASFHDTLAQVYARAKQYPRAVHAMKQAIAVDPGHPVWQWHLLDLYKAGGFDEQAARLSNELELQYPLGRPAMDELLN